MFQLILKTERVLYLLWLLLVIVLIHFKVEKEGSTDVLVEIIVQINFNKSNASNIF